MSLLLGCLFFAVSSFVLPAYSAAIVIRVSPAIWGGHDDDGCVSAVYPHHDCATLDYALSKAHQFKRNITIQLTTASGEYELKANSSVTTFEGVSGFHIIGHRKNSVIQCKGATGLSFYNSSNLLFHNLKMIGCGKEAEMTILKENRNIDKEVIMASMLFLQCSNLTISYVQVWNCIGTCVMLYNSMEGNVIIRDDVFHNSRNAINENCTFYQSGGLLIGFVQCISFNGKGCSSYNNSTIKKPKFHFEIKNCVFANNTAVADNHCDTQRMEGTAAGGGGMTILLGRNSRGVTINIVLCQFNNNSAKWGGGILISIQEGASGNRVQMQHSIFTSNKGKYDDDNACSRKRVTGGGGVVLFLNSKVRSNTVLFKNIKFNYNEAYVGGGMLIMASYTGNLQQSNKIIFKSTVWSKNRAYFGSAIYLSAKHDKSKQTGIFCPIIFRNCTFNHNTIKYHTHELDTPNGAGTIYANSVSIRFKDNNSIIHNTGSGIYSIGGTVELVAMATVTFEENTANTGAGISLTGNSDILMNNGSSIEFLNNAAVLYGGAIYWTAIAFDPLYTMSTNCFIRYKDSDMDPARWPVKFYFANNSAGMTGNDIYGTTIKGCVYMDLTNSTTPTVNYNRVFNWSSDVWVYDSFNSSNNSIATAPSHFISNNETTCEPTTYNITAFPGKIVDFNIDMIDDRSAEVPKESLLLMGYNSNKSILFTAADKILLTGLEGDHQEIEISTLQPREITTKVALKMNDCPLGFDFNYDKQKCLLGDYPFIRMMYDSGIEYNVSIQRGYWIGILENETVVSQCFFCPFNTGLPAKNYVSLPLVNNVTRFLCGYMKRKGALCQQCIDGYAPAINSDNYKCVKCNENAIHYSWMYYFIESIIPISAILIIVIVFNISITSGPANSFVFFAQVISTTFGVDAGRILDYTSIAPATEWFRRAYITIYGFWNLNFFRTRTIFLHCLGPNVTALNLLVLEYLTAAYPLIVLAFIAIMVSLYDKGNHIVVCLFRPLHRVSARFSRFLNLRNSMMDAFVTFLVLSYAKFATTSAYLLYPSPLLLSGGRTLRLVSYMDSRKTYASSEYSFYLITSLLVSLFVCILMPAILLLYSTKVFYRFLNKFRINCLLPGDKIQHFLNAFHHCYKDGSNTGEHDRRFFGSFYLFARFFMLLCFPLARDWPIQILMQQVYCTFAILAFTILRPYKNNHLNIADSAMFTLLAAINAFTLYQMYLAIANLPLSVMCFVIQMIFVFIPVICAVFILLFNVVRHVCLGFMKWQERKRRGYTLISNTDVVHERIN